MSESPLWDGFNYLSSVAKEYHCLAQIQVFFAAVRRFVTPEKSSQPEL